MTFYIMYTSGGSRRGGVQGVRTPPLFDHNVGFLTLGPKLDPPLNVDDVTRAMSKGGVLVNVQEWGCFSICRRTDDVTQIMSKGGACECPRLRWTPPPPSKILDPPLYTNMYSRAVACGGGATAPLGFPPSTCSGGTARPPPCVFGRGYGPV